MVAINKQRVQLAREYVHRGKVHLDLWDEDLNKRRVEYNIPFKIYVKETVNKKFLRDYDTKLCTLQDIDGIALLKIEFTKYFKFLEAIRWFQNAKVPAIYSTNYVLEYMLEHDLICNDYLDRWASLDIEVDPNGLNIKDISYEQPIVAASIKGYDGRSYTFNVTVADDLSVEEDDEKELIQKVYSVLMDYRSVLGWNIIGFDWPYLKERAIGLGLDDLDWGLFMVFDVMAKYKKFIERDRKPGEITDNKLNSAAWRMLKKRKVDINIHKYMELLRDDPALARKYVEEDAVLAGELYQIKGIGSLCEVDVAIAQKLHIFPSKTHPTYIFETYLEQIARKNKIRLPYKWEHYQEKVKKKGEGGLVLEPNRGLKKNVWACDFASLYPNIIRTHNIGINNAVWKKKYVDSGCFKTREGVGFKKHIKSLNAMIMDELIDTRMEYRNLLNDPKLSEDQRRWYETMSGAYKLMLVSANGILDNKYFKYRNQRLYNATTITGQWYTMAVKKIAERMGYEVYYGDTDSLFLEMPADKTHKECVNGIPFIEDELNERLKKLAIKTFNLDTDNYHIDIRFEKIYSKIYFSEKKNYVGKMTWKDYKWLDPEDVKSTDAKGIVMMKYNTIPIVKEAMREIFNILLSDLDNEKEINKRIVIYLTKLKADLYARKRDELLMKSQKVDSLEGYKSDPAHVRAAKKLDQMGLFEPGMNVEYIEDKTGSVLLYGIDTGNIARRTYDFYWRLHVGKWVEKIVGRDVSSVKALGFGYTRPTKSLLED